MEKEEDQDQEWTTIIKPRNSLLSVDFKELWHYRDLIGMFVKRDITIIYKQTILGPLWFFIQPMLTTVMYMVVFGGIAKISTDGLPQPLFYLSGICLWQYFANCLDRTSSTFITNANIFGKVYFPRLVIPFSIVISNLIQLAIQFVLFLIVYSFYILKGVEIVPNIYLTLFPLLILMTAGLSLGFGILFSSMTTKYKDLTILLTFCIQLWMYATPVIYPLSFVTNGTVRFIMELNPLTSIIEAFKFGVLGVGTFSWGALGYSFSFMVILLAVGIIVFNRVQRSFMDTV